MVLRVLGISSSALLVMDHLPGALGGWRLILAAVAALVLYGIPAEFFIVVAERTADRTAPQLLRLLFPLELLVAPIAAPLAWLGALAGRLVGRPSAAPPGVTETEMELMVSQNEQAGELDAERSEMIRNVLDFGDVTAGQVMVPRRQITALDATLSGRELLRLASESGHSRYPVYRERRGDVEGILHVKDLLLASLEDEAFEVEPLIRKPPLFVPETMSASAVLREMRARRHHLAVVVDEFGGMSGIVTLEDLLEQIVGDIQDEHDHEDAPVVELAEGRWLADASVPVAELSRLLRRELPEAPDYHSLGGFIVQRLGRVPRPGQQLSELGLQFTVREADERRVSRVEIEQLS